MTDQGDPNFYPGSKHTYQDPLSKAETGSAQVEATTTVDLSDPDLKEAINGNFAIELFLILLDVRNDKSDTNYCLFG